MGTGSEIADEGDIDLNIPDKEISLTTVYRSISEINSDSAGTVLSTHITYLFTRLHGDYRSSARLVIVKYIRAE